MLFSYRIGWCEMLFLGVILQQGHRPRAPLSALRVRLGVAPQDWEATDLRPVSDAVLGSPPAAAHEEAGLTPPVGPLGRLGALLGALVTGLCYADVFRRADLTGPLIFDPDDPAR
jgi:hypothetical protein